VAPPGLEAFTAAEVRALGCKVPRVGHGGFSVKMTTAELYAANLQLRTASRVLLRVGRFQAVDKAEFFAGFRKLSFDRYLSVGSDLVVRVDSVASKLQHTGMIEALVRELLGSLGGPTVRVRLDHDTVTVSVDASGDHLHRRGWREATAKAPLRETLAAALLMAARFDGAVDAFVDPMCGSGTIAIEAALSARNIASGRLRSFAFETWPSFDESVWERVRAKAADGVLESVPRLIVGCDRDPGAIEAAIDNAERAGVDRDIEFRQSSISNLALPAGTGLLATNPPYGVRVSAGNDLRNLYDTFGRVVRERADGWRIAMIVADRALVTRVIASPVEVATLENGGLPVSIMLSR
jgi:putative N6-adenine-specific DNA methylase